MTGQKRKNVSPERKPPPPRNKREPDRIVALESAISKLQNLSQNRHLEDQYDRFGKHVAGQLRNYHFVASSFSRRKYKVY
jgi:hypothetical protein